MAGEPASKTDLVCSRMGEGLERFGGELLGQKRTAGAEHRGVLPKRRTFTALKSRLTGARASGVPLKTRLWEERRRGWSDQISE